MSLLENHLYETMDQVDQVASVIAITQVGIYYWRDTVSVPSSDFWYLQGTGVQYRHGYWSSTGWDLVASTGLVLEDSTGPVLSVGTGIVLARPLLITWLGVGSQYWAGT